MAPRHNFRKLKIWKEGIEIVIETYSKTKKFPRSETYGLSSQMQRASVSIPSNIAEGTSRGTDKHFIQYLESALGSAFEWETQLIISRKLEYISEDELLDLSKKVQSIQGKVTRFIESLR